MTNHCFDLFPRWLFNGPGGGLYGINDHENRGFHALGLGPGIAKILLINFAFRAFLEGLIMSLLRNTSKKCLKLGQITLVKWYNLL